VIAEVAPFAVAIVVTIWFVLHAPDRIWHAAMMMTMALTMGWAASNISWVIDALGYLPVIDFLVAIAAVMLVLEVQEKWSVSIFILSVIQLLVDVVYQVMGMRWYTPFVLVSDVIFICQLASLASVGGLSDRGIRARHARHADHKTGSGKT